MSWYPPFCTAATLGYQVIKMANNIYHLNAQENKKYFCLTARTLYYRKIILTLHAAVFIILNHVSTSTYPVSYSSVLSTSLASDALLFLLQTFHFEYLLSPKLDPRLRVLLPLLRDASALRQYSHTTREKGCILSESVSLVMDASICCACTIADTCCACKLAEGRPSQG